MVRIKSTGWRQEVTTENRFRSRSAHSMPDLYNIQYCNNAQVNVYQFEDVQRRCVLCERHKSGLFYCRIPARLKNAVLVREEIINNQSVCAVCANWSLI